VSQTAKRRDALMAVDHHIAPRSLACRHHHDGLLLAVLFEA
jgi:hypothetical protein